jgi:hypothetical protein
MKVKLKFKPDKRSDAQIFIDTCDEELRDLGVENDNAEDKDRQEQ